jgi:serine protease
VSAAWGRAIKDQLGGSLEASVEVLATDYTRMSGTSMATPHASGVAALVWSSRPSLNADQVQQLLVRSAKDMGSAGHDKSFGHGLVQAADALRLAEQEYPRQ